MASQVAKWACHKLECLADFAQKVSAGTQDDGVCCVELFAGYEHGPCPETSCPGTGRIEARLLRIKPPFSLNIFVAANESDAAVTSDTVAPIDTTQSARIITGNSLHEAVMRQVFDNMPRSTAGFALIDPPGYAALRWSVIKKLAQHGVDWKGHKMDLLIIFPLEMALLRNLTRRECENSINRLYGNTQWQAIRRKRIEAKLEPDKLRSELVELFTAG
jgi:three-Cys-motif partner protein